MNIYSGGPYLGPYGYLTFIPSCELAIIPILQIGKPRPRNVKTISPRFQVYVIPKPKLFFPQHPHALPSQESEVSSEETGQRAARCPEDLGTGNDLGKQTWHGEEMMGWMDLEAVSAAREPSSQCRLWVKSLDSHGSKGS